MDPGSYDFEIQRGNTLARLFRFKSGATAFDLTGDTLVFRATVRGVELLRKETPTEFAMPSPAAGEATLNLTPEETRTVPLGRVTRFEIEHRPAAGGQYTLVRGMITGIDGVNDDATD